MPLPEFSMEENAGTPLPVESMTPPSGAGAAFQEGVATSLLASGLTRVKGAVGDQTFVPYADAAKEMKASGYDASVLPDNGLSRGYLDALKAQQSAIARNAEIAQDAGLEHSTGLIPSKRGLLNLAGGSAADSPLFLVGGGAAGLGLRAAGVEAGELGLLGRVAVRSGEGAGLAGAYDVGRKEAGTAPGDKDLGMYDFARDMALGGVLGATGGLHKGAIPTEESAQAFLREKIPGVQITSGFRTVEHNAEIGGAPGSLHTRGQAVDVVLPKGMTAEQLRAQLDQAGMPVSEFRVEKKGDPHSTGDHIHWGWGAKPGKGAAPDVVDQSARLQRAVSDAMEDRIPSAKESLASADTGPKPVWQTPEADAQLAKMNEKPQSEKTSDLEVLRQRASDAASDAEATHKIMHGEDADMTPLKDHIKAAEDSVQPQVDLAKAVKAALQCASVMGFD